MTDHHRGARFARLLLALTLAALVTLVCNMPGLTVSSEDLTTSPYWTPSPAPTASPIPPTAVIATLTPTDPPTATLTATPSPTPSPSLTPYGCERPPDDQTRIWVGDEMILNQRTVWMLQRAQQLYGGSHDLLKAITQGSYTSGEAASFGTHDGGGAADISVRDLNDWNHILYEDMDAMILALREVGFAAWVRQPGALYANSPIHIHAIAIGDPELSQAAQDQLTGPDGYFRGFNGLPVDPPQPDEYGGPYLCPWMIEMGYADLRDQNH